MHLCSRIALLMAIASVAKCSHLPADASTIELESQDHEEHADGEELVILRDGRSMKKNNLARLNWGILDSIIDFSSGICATGTCMSQKECKNMNGTDTSDRCVQGFGVCCVVDGSGGPYVGGDITISGDGGDFFNPGSTEVATRQAIAEETIYKATVVPADDDVQIMVNIRDLNIMGPVEGDCGNDSLTITGTNPGPEIPTLCGVASGQILYLDVDNTDGPIVFAMTITSNNTIDQTWNISISFLKAADSVPRRCLQYHTATEGTIESFNFDLDAPGMMINDQTYSICFGYAVGYCDIAFNFARLDLGRLDKPCTNSYLLIGDDKQCGDLIDISLQANSTGPINVGVRSDSMNEIEEEGFSATYTMLGC